MLLAACGGSGSDTSPAPVPPPSNSSPVAQPDEARTRPGVAVDIAVLTNDSDAEGGVLTVVPTTTVASAMVTVQPDNRLRVVPVDGFGGTLEFTYQAQDAAGARSAPTTVRVVVGPVSRAMIGTGFLRAGTPRVFISGFRSGETAPLLEGFCGSGQFAAGSSDMRTLVAVQCGATPGRKNLVVMAPRAAILSPPVPLLSDVVLASGFAVSPDGSSVIVAERVTGLEDLASPGTYELVRVDVASRTVSRRLPLPGVDGVSGIRRLGGDRVLLMTGSAGVPFPVGGELYLADLAAETVVEVGPGSGPLALEMLFTSADGRFVLFQDFMDLVGYDLTQPTTRITFWGTQARGSYVSQMSVAPAPNGATMLVLASDMQTQASTVWELPLENPSAARELRPCRNDWSPAPAFHIVAADRFLLVCDSATANHSDVLEISLANGDLVKQWTPAGGVPGLLGVQRQGPDAVLLFYEEPVTVGVRRRLAYVHASSPGILELVMPDEDLDDAFIGPGDPDGQTFALTTLDAGVYRPHIVDVNLLTRGFPISEGLAANEEADALMVFLPPDE